MSPSRPLRFALHVPSEPLQAWQRRCLQRLHELTDARPVAIIRSGTSADGGDATASFPGLPLIAWPDQQPMQRLNDLDLDFVLSWESDDRPVDPGLAAIARFGQWRYQFGDWFRFRGGPPGFWEVYAADSVSGAMLVRVTDDPDSVIVLREGYLRTQLLSASRNRRQLEDLTADWAAQVCTDIANGVLDRLSAPPRRASCRRRAAPSGVQRAVLGISIVLRMASVALRDLFRHEQWNVGVVDQPLERFVQSAERAPTRWLPAPARDEIRADPFGVWRDGTLTILCEYLHFDSNRGVIVAIDADNPGPRGAEVRIGPTPAVHLSYPFLLEHDKRLWCIPETHEAREIALYELERFPDRWRKAATLVPDTVTVDATVFQHGGRWWLAGSDAAPKGANSELRLWFAPELSGPWQPHPGNPVKIDVRSARPGGTPFVHDGVLYRPAQDCSTAYGRRIVINRVITLTPAAFHEECAAVVEPERSGPYPGGLHTLSCAGPVTLIDGKRSRFIPAQFARTLRSWLGIRRNAHD